MAEKDFGDYFISDTDEDLVEEDEDIVPPVVLPAPAAPAPSQIAPMTPPPAPAPPVVAPVVPAASTPGPAVPAVDVTPVVVPEAEAASVAAPAAAPSEETAPQPEVTAPQPEVTAPTPAPAAPAAPAAQESREARLARALNDLMIENVDIQAAALVSLDGFTMASALPEGMHEDRVGAMSAAILGLGERAAAELGRGALSQVFIEGDGGYVVLIAAGNRAVLTALADSEAKLGLVLYDMRDAAEAITSILG